LQKILFVLSQHKPTSDHGQPYCRSQENGNAASFDMSQEINLSLTSVQDQTNAKYPVAGGSA
jgi:hypothetical protein